MLERIMVALDGSKLAETVLPLATAIARAYESRVVLLRVAHTRPHIDVEAEAEAEISAVREAEEYLAEVASREALAGLAIETSVPFGRPAEMIADQADARQTDLIVMATHGRGGVARLVLGSVADRVLHAVDSSLLVVRPSAEHDAPALDEEPLRIVVPLDGTDLAEQVIGLGADLARRLGATLCLVRVVPLPEAIETLEGRAVLSTDAQIEADRLSAEQYLATVAAPLQADGVVVETRVRTGDVVDEIELATTELKASLVVMSTHGRSGVSRWVYGSVADRLIRESRVPVLLQRAGEAKGFFPSRDTTAV